MPPFSLTLGAAMKITPFEDNTRYIAYSEDRHLTPDYHYRVANDLPLLPLPYSMNLDIGDKKPVIYTANSFNASTKWPYTFWDFDNIKHVVPIGQWSGWYTMTKPEPTSRGIKQWFNPFVLSDVSDQLTKFDNGLLLKIKGQSLPVLMALKERKQTAELITSFFQKSLTAIKHVRHPKKFFYSFMGRPPRAWENRRLANSYKRLLKRQVNGMRVTVHDAFLEYRFAYIPLIHDIVDLYKGAERAMQKGQDSFSRKAISKTLEGKTSLSRFAGSTIDWTVTLQGHQKAFWTIDDASLALYSQFQSVSATVWDSVPYSFVVDGLVNISKYLECSNAVLGVKFLSGYKSLKQIGISKATFTKVNGSDLSGMPAKILTTGPSARYQLNFKRQLLTNFPEPRLEFPYKEYINLQHIVDLSALISQKVKLKF